MEMLAELTRYYSTKQVKLRGVLYKYGVRVDDMDDLLQDTYIQASSALKRGIFKGTCALETWLIGIALNLVRNRIARRKVSEKNIRYMTVIMAEHGADINRHDYRWDLDKIEAAVKNMPIQMRSTFEFYIETEDYDEVMEKFKIPRVTARTRIHKARKFLLEQLNSGTPARKV